MRKIRAIYIWDIRDNQCEVFELDASDKKFKMIIDGDFSYPLECILEDSNWIVFGINGTGDDEEVKIIKREEMYDTLEAFIRNKKNDTCCNDSIYMNSKGNWVWGIERQNGNDFYVEEHNISFCPFCGKKLIPSKGESNID